AYLQPTVRLTLIAERVRSAFGLWCPVERPLRVRVDEREAGVARIAGEDVLQEVHHIVCRAAGEQGAAAEALEASLAHLRQGLLGRAGRRRQLLEQDSGQLLGSREVARRVEGAAVLERRHDQTPTDEAP